MLLKKNSFLLTYIFVYAGPGAPSHVPLPVKTPISPQNLFQQPRWDAKLQGRDGEQLPCSCCGVSRVGQAGGSWQEPSHGELCHPAVQCPGRAEGVGQGCALRICPKVSSSKHVKHSAWWLVSVEASVPDLEVTRLYFFCLHLKMGRKHSPSYYKAGPTKSSFTS